MQKICIVSKIKNKNNSGKQVKNKGKFIIVLTLMMIVFNISYNKASANNTNDFGRYHVYSYNESFRYIKYKNLPQRIHEYYYINNESKILPAYCMNLGLGGAETIDGGYDVDAEKFIDDNVVNSIVLNGYPYKTVNELGVDNESQARYATQFAIWIKLNNLDINQIVPMEDQYLKVVQAIKNIYYNGINSNEIYTNGVSIEEVDNLYNEDKDITENNNLDKLDESYYSKMYKLEYGDNVLNIDLNVKGNSYDNNLKLAAEASKYGWDHINFSYNQNKFANALEFKKDLQDNLDIGIDYTLEIDSGNVNEIRKIARKFRNKSSCISVIGGDLKVNRAVLENIQLDVLSRPYLKRYDSGLNQVLAKESLNNNVAVEICFIDILKSYLTYRAKTIANIKDVISLHKKFDFPLILSSRAESVFDIKTTKDFSSVFLSVGLTQSEIDKSFTSAENILEFNKNRKNMVLKGVREVNDEA